MTDKIHIEEIQTWTKIGINDIEREHPQTLYVDLDLYLDLKPSGEADDLSKTIDYRRVKADVLDLGSITHVTVEGFAEKIAKAIKQKYALDKLTVTIKKPGALSGPRGAKYAAITLNR